MAEIISNAPLAIEPLDKVWNLNYLGEREPLSPFPRVNKMRDDYYAQEDFYVDHKRAVLVTEAYQKHKNQPQQIKCAEALAYALRNLPVSITPEELIAGESGAPRQVGSVFPEHSYSWVPEELRDYPWDKRIHVQYKITDESKQKLLEIEDFWKDNAIDDAIVALMTDEQKQASHLGKELYSSSLLFYGGIGHYIPNYERILHTGFGALRRRIVELQGTLDITLPADMEKSIFYKASLIALDGTVDFINRYAALAEEMASGEEDPKRAEELRVIAANCRHIAAEPPRGFYEALQLWFFVTLINQIESNGESISYGRMDQYLYPFYKKSLQDGSITREYAQEILETVFVKVNWPMKIKNRHTIEVSGGRTFGGDCLLVGGVNEQGLDATNDLTYMLLDAHAHTRMRSPWSAVRLHANTPHELKVKTANLTRAGFGHPKVFNDEVLIPMMLSRKGGRTLAEARNYGIVGCVEPDTAGYEFGCHDLGYFNIAKVLELALNNGRCMDCGTSCKCWETCGKAGKRFGLETGCLADFKSFDEVLKAFETQMRYFTDIMAGNIIVIEEVHKRLKPLPYLSLLIDDCVEKGVDVLSGGARYNATGPQGIAIATVADGLTAIKQLVFEEKKTTGAELLDALLKNWKGHEPLRALINSDQVHHYGNDDDYADEMAVYVCDTFAKLINGRPNGRGGEFEAGIYSVIANVGFGLGQWASPDGRKAGDALSDNLGPVHGHDSAGPTALIKSVTKIDHSKAKNGTLLNMKFSPSSVSGEKGLNNFINLVDTYFQMKGLHTQFGIVDRSTMEDAQAHPEKYPDLLVRVAGYSAYFVELSPMVQKDIIERTELSFD